MILIKKKWKVMDSNRIRVTLRVATLYFLNFPTFPDFMGATIYASPDQIRE